MAGPSTHQHIHTLKKKTKKKHTLDSHMLTQTRVCAIAHQAAVRLSAFLALCTCHVMWKCCTWGKALQGHVLGATSLIYYYLILWAFWLVRGAEQDVVFASFAHTSCLGRRACYLYNLWPLLFSICPILVKEILNLTEPSTILRPTVSHSASDPFGIIWGLIRPHPPAADK